MKRTDSPDPIFIHSMFRTGSTYIFDVFRRSPNGYWCYQEPLHEALLKAEENPQLLVEAHQRLMTELRHPVLEDAYWKEMHVIGETWKPLFKKEFIYDDFFARNKQACESLRSYVDALIELAQGRPVFGLTRSFGRSRWFKTEFAATDIYLWRNPWDQWWSYKINNGYFDATNLLIVNAHDVPDIVHKLRQVVLLEEYHSEDIGQEFGHFVDRSLSANESYLVFYVLWFCAIAESAEVCDVMLNIDKLSESERYQNEVKKQLLDRDIADLDFSDCRIFRGFYTQNDADFFNEIENQAHDLLVDAGYGRNSIDEILALRKIFAPHTQRFHKKDVGRRELVATHVDRLRPLVFSLEERLVRSREHSRELRSTLSSSQEDNLRLQKELSSSQEDNLRLQKELSSSQEDNLRLQKELSSSQEDNLRLQKELGTSAEESDRLKDILRKSREYGRLQEIEIARTREWVRQLTAELEFARNEAKRPEHKAQQARGGASRQNR